MAKKTKRAIQARNQTNTRDVDRWLDRATRQLIASDYAGVITTAQRVLNTPVALPEQRVEAYHRLGAAYMMQQQHEETFAVLSKALKLAPDEPLLWYNRGMAARYSMRLGQSLRDFERAEELDKTGVLAERLAEDLPFARQAATHEMGIRGPYFTLDHLIAQEELFQQAVAAMAEHRWAEAEPLFREVITMGDGLPQPWGNLGLCLLMQREFDAAEAALRRALEIDPSYAIARQNLAGLPYIRASGKLPEMRVTGPLEGKEIKQTLSFLVEDEKPPR